MAGNNSIQILRGTSSQISSSNETLLDGQLLYDKTNNRLYIGNGEEPVRSATLVSGMSGDDGLSIYRSSQTGRTTSSTTMTTSYIDVPDGREIQVGDLIIANTTYSYLYRVTGVPSGVSYVNVDYLQSLRGASGVSGSRGPTGPTGAQGPAGTSIYSTGGTYGDSTTVINNNVIDVPAGRTLNNGDLLVCVNNGNVFIVTQATTSTYSSVSYVGNIRGPQGPAGSPGATKYLHSVELTSSDSHLTAYFTVAADKATEFTTMEEVYSAIEGGAIPCTGFFGTTHTICAVTTMLRGTTRNLLFYFIDGGNTQVPIANLYIVNDNVK